MLTTLIKLPFKLLWRVAPGLRPMLRASRRRLRRDAMLLYFLRDGLHARRHMRWTPDDNRYGPLSSELMFQFHKLEKGLCIEGAPRFFGADPAFATAALMARWRDAGHPLDDPLYVGALETLRAYRARLEVTPPPAEQRDTLFGLLDRELADVSAKPEYATPRPYRRTPVDQAATLDSLLESRRSVRAFSSERIPLVTIRDAVGAAALAPSACNRQPWRVHVFEDRATIDRMLALQNGNRGFGHTIQTLLVIASDTRAFFDSTERHEPFIDGGLFSMALVLSLQARGVASCCLNWCVTPEVDAAAHARGNIPEHEAIVMYLAVGYATESARAPRSPRRRLDTVLVRHDTATSA